MLEAVSSSEGIVVGVFALWLLITVVRQLSDDPKWWAWDVLSAIPRWTFFTTTPISVDYSILYRDHFADGSSGPWQEIPYPRRRRWRDFVFNPDGRCRKVLYILTLQCVTAVQSGGKEALINSPHYQALLDAVLHFPGTAGSQAREMVIFRSFGFLSEQPPQPIIQSGPQPLGCAS